MITTKERFDITPLTTFRVRTLCRKFIEYTSADDIPEVVAMAETPIFHIGGGSNVLFTRDFPGTVLHSAISGIEWTDTTDGGRILRVGAGCSLDKVAQWACEQQRWGLENLSGIPGEAGAAAVQNVGAYGTEICDILKEIEAYDLKTSQFVILNPSDCRYGYRDSIFKHEHARYIIHHVSLLLKEDGKPNLSYPALAKHFELQNIERMTSMDVRDAVLAIRGSKLPQPDDMPSAGSFFKNPVVTQSHYERISAGYEGTVPCYEVQDGIKIPAAWLIEHAYGRAASPSSKAQLWHKQPLVIVNPEGRASAAEIIALEKDIIERVKKAYDITLSPEVEHV